jgi:hypothetical protein
MEPGDDDERANAYNRYVYNEFADIVHHYDDTADHVDHDKLDDDDYIHDLDHFDGAEYDDNGDLVIQFGSIFGSAVDEFDKFDDIPDDYEFGTPVDDEYVQQRLAEFLRAAVEHFKFYISDNIFQYPLYNRFRGVCKRPRGVYYYDPKRDSPPS